MADIKKSRVAVIPCDGYDEDTVYEQLKKGIVELGGIGKFVSPEEKVLVKPNFLSAATPERAVTVHPAVLKSVLRLLAESGCADVRFGDSPGYGTCESAVKMLGIEEEDCYGAHISPMSEAEHVEFPEGMTCKEFDFCKEIVESDAIINVCKMKTHALERITGAVKNVYGFICGYRKAAGHVKFPNATVFARMLADIHRCTKPRLHIMDGIVAMEGNGPGSGTPTPMNVLIVSDDPVAVDTVFCYLVNLDPEIIPTNSQGMRMGIGTDNEDEIEIVLCGEIAGNTEADPADEKSNADTFGIGHAETYGSRIISKDELFEKYGNASFDVPRGKPRGTFLMRYSGFMTKLARRPMIDKNKCVKCGICVNHCPVPGKAVDFKNGKENPPVYDYKKCIRCYCCQEMCPKHAISARHGLFGRKDK